jgi:hypothetical protein
MTLNGQEREREGEREKKYGVIIFRAETAEPI